MWAPPLLFQLIMFVNMRTQNAIVLELLQDHQKGITQFDVLEHGILRLAARVKDLKDDGYMVYSEMETNP